MIDELITALSKEVGMSAEEMADTIWLALQIQESQLESVSSDSSLVKEDIGANENKITSSELEPQTLDSNEREKNLDSKVQKVGISPRSKQPTKSLDLSLKTPNTPSLRQPLTLARAFKPLMRRIPAGTNFVLDEAATIEGIAITNAKLWLPVLRPTLEPWLDLELVVDESISMQIWRQTIRDLEKLLKNYGIFRDVRVWGMTAKDGEKVQVCRGVGAGTKNKFPRSSKELIDGSDRRLILVVSDCVSSSWRDGTVTKALEIWANSVPTAIIQMLPKWLWKRTALGRASEVKLRALAPGVSNQNLIAEEVSLWEELEKKKGVKVPIFTLEEDKATTWAQMLSGKSSVSTLGFVFKDAPVKKKRLFNFDYSQLSAEDRVQAFRVTASPMARKLVGLLAAAPVISLPVVRLIRGALLKESLQVNVAEVFLGGLLRPLSEIKVDTNPDDVLYGFVDGVRELLIDSMPSDRVINVVDKVSEYVAERVGLSLEDFAAVLRREKYVGDSGVVEEIGYFAMVTAQVLKRLGGEYGKVAEELERNSKVERILYHPGLVFPEIKTNQSIPPQKSINIEQSVTNLTQWVNNIFDSGWQMVEEILGIKEIESLFAIRSQSNPRAIKAKKINLGKQDNIRMIVDVMSISNNQRSIIVWVYPSKDRIYLPLNLKFYILDSSGEFLQQKTVNSKDKWMKQEITGKLEEKFSLKFQLSDFTVFNHFVI